MNLLWQSVGARIARPYDAVCPNDDARSYDDTIPVGARIARPYDAVCPNDDARSDDDTIPVGARIARPYDAVCPNDDARSYDDTIPVGARIARPCDTARPCEIAYPNDDARPNDDTQPSLSDKGIIADNAICNISRIYPGVTVEKYVIMPNHIHMIIRIQSDCMCDADGGHPMCANTNDGNGGRAMRAPTISTVVNQFKGVVTKQIGWSIWQKLFYDHIIRNEKEYVKIWEYIDKNPVNWHRDSLYVNDQTST